MISLTAALGRRPAPLQFRITGAGFTSSAQAELNVVSIPAAVIRFFHHLFDRLNACAIYFPAGFGSGAAAGFSNLESSSGTFCSTFLI